MVAAENQRWYLQAEQIPLEIHSRIRSQFPAQSAVALRAEHIVRNNQVKVPEILVNSWTNCLLR
jgi:hypothetical protein